MRLTPSACTGDESERLWGPVSTDRNQVQAIPRRLLDPRRPTGKPTAAEQEEGLIPYDILLPDDPRRTLSHDHEVRLLPLP